MNEQEFNRINAEKLSDIIGVDDTVAVATTTHTHLPTAEEYRASINHTFRFPSEWSEPKYKCPKCGGGMCRNEMIVLTSYPAQYQYRCNKCGHVDYQYR